MTGARPDKVTLSYPRTQPFVSALSTAEVSAPAAPVPE